MGEKLEINENFFLVRKPHFRKKEHHLFFLISKRPFLELSPEEEDIWLKTEKEIPIKDILRDNSKNRKEAVQKLLEKKILEKLPPFPLNSRKEVAVIEPHMDDAALSVGGTMLLNKEHFRFTILSVAGNSNFTTYYYLDRDFFDPMMVSSLRQAESALASRMVLGSHRFLNCREAPLRYQDGTWSLDWYRANKKSVSAFIGHRSSEKEYQDWKISIWEALKNLQPEEIWFPMGIGTHTDHELTRNACLEILLENPSFLKNTQVKMYQEVPYSIFFPWHTAKLIKELTKHGAALKQEIVDVTTVFNEKLRLNSVFSSQFKIEILDPKIKQCALSVTGTKSVFGEFFCRLDSPPRKISWFAFHADSEFLGQLLTEVQKWLKKNKGKKFFRIILGVGTARWAEDFSLIQKLLPGADFQIYANPGSLGEIRKKNFKNTQIIPFKKSLLFLLKTAFSWFLFPSPIVLFTGRGREKLTKLFGFFLFRSSVLVSPTLNHLSLALREIKNRSSLS